MMTIKKIVKCAFAILFVMSSMVSYAQNEDSLKRTTTIQLSMYEHTNPDKAATDYYMRGKEALILNQDMELSAKYFMKALEKNPEHAATNYELARFTTPNNALPYSTRAHQADSSNFWYQDQLSDIYSSLRYFPEAITIAERMVKQRPDSDDAFKKLTTFYYYNGEIEKSMSLIDTIEARFGANPELALLHTNMIKNLSSPTAAMVKKVQDYIAFYDDLPHFVLALGDIYQTMGLNEQAIQCYQQAKVIDPDELRGDVALFDYYNRRQNQGEAVKYLPSLFKFEELNVAAKIALYKEFIETNVYLYRNFFRDVDNASMTLMLAYPQNVEVRKLYSEHLLRKGEIGSALAFNKTGFENGIIDFNALQLILEIEAYNKNFDSMKVYIDKGLELFPDKTQDLNMAKVSLYSMTNQYPKAVEVVKDVIKTAVGDSLLSVYNGVLGDLYHSMNKNKLAYKAYDKALKYNSENIIVLNNYGYYLSIEDKYLEKALKMASIVIDKEPSNSTYLDTYAWILYKMKRYEEARKIIIKAVALDTTNSSSLMLHYGDILYKLGQKALADGCWQKALNYGEDKKVIEQRLNQK